MPIFMWVILSVIIIQRLVELVIARSNEQWMKQRGAIEKGKQHYKWFIIIHTLFFLSLIAEIIFRNQQSFSFNYFLFTAFIITQIGRIWCIATLGRFWNTKIIIAPQFDVIKRGPYKYVKHPNYIIVGIELFVIPSLFGAWFTAIVFPILHALLLYVRIPVEEKAVYGH
ncbi:isoprenylcysteine carboxyl methyltransferase family protein [Virgibacillus sp. Bac330]|uniref:isoprenylcysteine carboxyl methyltransferase family protein n=1 Tax=Virgibacillus sp. Bac330 TaxID=2419841 RepID=UPI000EF4B941|nr:isoprenylcysteine carboxylmethyltransferase family protein [Virgibacillus sp. Bac330]